MMGTDDNPFDVLKKKREKRVKAENEASVLNFKHRMYGGSRLSKRQKEIIVQIDAIENSLATKYRVNLRHSPQMMSTTFTFKSNVLHIADVLVVGLKALIKFIPRGNMHDPSAIRFRSYCNNLVHYWGECNNKKTAIEKPTLGERLEEAVLIAKEDEGHMARDFKEFYSKSLVKIFNKLRKLVGDLSI
ncbi:hypothetical protein ACFLYT_00495 [Nanoarchaeota archaeon]